jgi:hypothetical protein
MSYCRFGESDIYLFRSVTGGIECCCCSLSATNKFKLITGKKIRVEKPSIIKIYLRKNKRKKYGVKKVIKYMALKRGCLRQREQNFYRYLDVFEHLKRHQLAGDYIPEYVFERLYVEQKSSLNDLIECRPIKKK